MGLTSSTHKRHAGEPQRRSEPANTLQELTFRKPLVSSMATVSARALRKPPTSQPMSVRGVPDVPPPSPVANHPSIPRLPCFLKQ